MNVETCAYCMIKFVKREEKREEKRKEKKQMHRGIVL
jgi:hypothetical protein